MHRTEGFTYTASLTADRSEVQGMIRYGVIATEIDGENKSGDVAQFFVVFEDQGNLADNEIRAIALARRLALTIGNDPGPFKDV